MGFDIFDHFISKGRRLTWVWLEKTNSFAASQG